MENIKKIIKELFNSVDKHFLIRQYFFVVIIAFFMLKTGYNYFSFLEKILIVINTILYPFAKIAFDSVLSFLIGSERIIFLPLPIMLIIKIFISILLYGFAILIAPLSIGYILIRNRYMNMKKEGE